MRGPKRTWTRKACKRLGSDSWIWTGAVTSKGYPSRGVIGERRTELVHRAMLAEHLGRPLLPTEHVHHRCERELCVNPEHLQAMTRAEHRQAHIDLVYERMDAGWTFSPKQRASA